MYTLEEKHFQTFHQPYFSFKVLKETKTTEEIDELKALFKATWTDFKAWQLETANITPLPFGNIRVESWTNGWNLRNHFWCPFRHKDHMKDAPCLAILLDGEKLMIYLMFQHYKSEQSTISMEAYNEKSGEILPWYQSRLEKSPLYFWTNQEEDLQDFTFISSQTQLSKTLMAFAPLAEKATFSIGYVFTSPKEDLSTTLSNALRSLYPLYEKIVLP